MKPQFWNTRYQENENTYGYAPNQYLVDASALLPAAGRVLSIGEGEGRNSIWMAEQGFRVWALDYSWIGLQKAQKRARQLNLPIKYVCIDLSDWIWPEDYFDAIVVIFVHLSTETRKIIHSKMINSLKPKGYIIMQCFHKKQLQFNSGGPKSEEMLYTAELLQDDFKDNNFIDLKEAEVELDEGAFHQGTASVINLIVQKRPID